MRSASPRSRAARAGRWLPPPPPRRSAPMPSRTHRDGVGDALGAVGVGGCHRRRHATQRRCLRVPSSMELAMRSARPGSVAATTAATSLSADAFLYWSMLELAMRSARPGSVAAIAAATSFSADIFANVLIDGVGDALGAFGVGGCHRRRHVAQRRCLRGLVGEGVGDALGVAEEPGSAGRIGSCHRRSHHAQRPGLLGLAGDGVGDALGVADKPGSTGGIVPPAPRPFLYVSSPDGGITGRPGTVGTVGHGGGRRRQGPLDSRDQPPGIVTETLMPDTKRVTLGKTGEAVRQVRAARHDCVLHQDRDHPHPALKSRPDLQPDQVIGVIKPPPAPLISRHQPARADHRHQHHACVHRTGNRLSEIHPRLNRMHVHEDLLRAETIDQAIGQPPGKTAALNPAVADKNATAPRCAHAQSRYRKEIPGETIQFTACERHCRTRETGGQTRVGRFMLTYASPPRLRTHSCTTVAVSR